MTPTASMASSDAEMDDLREALIECSSETRRLVQPLLSLPAVQNMLLVFLSDHSRSFEDWIMDPQCRHRLSQLRDRVDSHDVPALTASYQAQVQLAAQQRLRTSKTLPRSFPPPIDYHAPTEHSILASTRTASSSTCAVANGKTKKKYETVTRENGTCKSNKNAYSDNGSRVTGATAQRNGTVKDNIDGRGTVEVSDASAGLSVSTTPSLMAGSRSAREDSSMENGAECLRQKREEEEGEEANDEDEDYALEDACEMLLVIAESKKEFAKSQFQRGEFMGAAETYRRAAESLDERAPPSSARTERLRQRIRDLYVTCMCNSAVAGFKAACAAPAPGEAHGLVVEACSRALERSGGTCPKARFWRARVKICQHMYEAAEEDLRKAVEEEGGAVNLSKKQQVGEGSSGSRSDNGGERGITSKVCVANVHANGHTANGSISNGFLSNGQAANGNIADVCHTAALHVPPNDDVVDAEAGYSSSGGDGDRDRNAADARDDRTQQGIPESIGERDSSMGRETGGSEEPKEEATRALNVASALTSASAPSEIARWLARVRAKIAQVHAARALAASQAHRRAGQATAARERSSKKAQLRARHGPGHVPRRPSSTPEKETTDTNDAVVNGTGNDGDSTRTSGRAEVEESRGSGRVGKRSERGGEEGEVAGVWRVPKPPLLNVANRSPATVMNDYSMHARFQPTQEYEQVTGDQGQAEYICSYSVGPNDRLVGKGRGTNTKTAKQLACIDLLQTAARAWNEENPDDLIDMSTMVPSPHSEEKKRAKSADTEITGVFKAYVAAWVDKVVADEIQEACFPIDLDKYQRKYVHRYLEEELCDPAVISKSCTVNRRRRLSVMRKAMMEGLAFLSGGKVVVVDIPGPPTKPSDVPDLAPFSRPPREPIVPQTTGAASEPSKERDNHSQNAVDTVVRTSDFVAGRVEDEFGIEGGLKCGTESEKKSGSGVTVEELPNDSVHDVASGNRIIIPEITRDKTVPSLVASGWGEARIDASSGGVVSGKADSGGWEMGPRITVDSKAARAAVM